MGDQRRSSWPWRKLKSSSAISSAKPFEKSSRVSVSQLASPGSSFTANESARFLENLSQEATATSTFVDDGRLLEANALREQAEESLGDLKQELTILMREVIAKEALVKQHQKVADEAISGWEKAERDAVSLKEDLEAAAQQRVILEDRIAQLDCALKECMRQVRHVRDEQVGKIEEAITCKTRQWEQIKAELEAKQAELQRRLLESDAQNSAMVKSLQERARKILEANDAKSKAETELKVLQVKLGSSEKDISALRYELQLLSKELEIRNEEVAFCKKSADIAHRQHLENVQKVAMLEADCQRLRKLVKTKLPGPAAIAQMRKEIEGLSERESYNATAEFKRRPSRSYASSTISFTNGHQRGTTSSINREVDMLRERLFSMEEENKLLKEALSKRIGELQTSRLLCAKTATKLLKAEDQLESLQGTPRGTRMNSFASISDEINIGFGSNDHDQEEVSCAESWASALIGELAHFRSEKITAKETIKEVTEPYKTNGSISQGSVLLTAKEVPLCKEECPLQVLSPPTEPQPALEMGIPPAAHQGGRLLLALSLLCKDLDHKLTAIEEQLCTGRESLIEEISTTGHLLSENIVIRLVEAAHQKFSELEKAIQGMGSTSEPSMADQYGVGTAVATMPNSESGVDGKMPTPRATIDSIIQEGNAGYMPEQSILDQIMTVAESGISNCEEDESRQGLEGTILTTKTSGTATLTPAVVKEEESRLVTQVLAPTSITSKEDECKSSALIAERDRNSDSATEDQHKLARSTNFNEAGLGFVICKLISVLETPAGGSTLGAECKEAKTDEQWEDEKQDLVACKERIMVGQSSVMEFLVRVGMAVGRAGGAGRELEGVLESIKEADVEKQIRVDVKAAGEARSRQCQEDNVKRGEEEAGVAEQVKQLKRQLEEVEREKEMVGEEREKLREEGARLAEDVARHEEREREVEARCEELQQTAQGFELQKDRSAVKVPHAQQQNLPKESELAEAKQRVAECENTILLLREQLRSLSSVKQPHSQQHETPTSAARHRPDALSRRRFNIGQDYAEVDQAVRPRGRRLPGQVVSGGHGNHRSSQQSGPVRVAHNQRKSRCHRGVESEGEEKSPPPSARSSPATSPARYLQHVPGGRASVIRASLTQSLDAVSSSIVKTRSPMSAGAGLGKLFSMSRRKC